MTRRVPAGMPWAFLVIVLVFGVGVLVFLAVDPAMQLMFEYMQDEATGDESAQYGIATLQTIWNYWPLWFLGALFTYGYVEAIRTSEAGGVPR